MASDYERLGIHGGVDDLDVGDTLGLGRGFGGADGEEEEESEWRKTLLQSIAWILDDDDGDANLWRESGEGSSRLMSDDNFSLVEEQLGFDLGSGSDFMAEEGGIDGDEVKESAPELDSMQNGGSGQEDSMERRSGREDREIEFRNTVLQSVLWVLNDDNDEDSWPESGEVNPRLVSDGNLCFHEEELGLHLNSDSNSDFLSESEEGEGDGGGEVEESVSELESTQEAEPCEDSCRCEDHFLCELPRRRIVGFETDSYSSSDVGHVLSDEAADVELEEEESVAGMESIQEDESAEDTCTCEHHFFCQYLRNHILTDSFSSSESGVSDEEADSELVCIGMEESVAESQSPADESAEDSCTCEHHFVCQYLRNHILTDSFSSSESVVSDEEADLELLCVGMEESVAESQSPADEATDWEQEDVDGSMVGSDAEESDSEFQWMQRGDLVVERLPSVLLVAEDRGEADGDMVCVVCYDEISLGEWATLLPCSHYYHGECILPWLKIRNTCPKCRYELPTYADYANDYFD